MFTLACFWLYWLLWRQFYGMIGYVTRHSIRPWPLCGRFAELVGTFCAACFLTVSANRMGL